MSQVRTFHYRRSVCFIVSGKLQDSRYQAADIENAVIRSLLLLSARVDGNLHDVVDPNRRVLHVNQRLAVLRGTSNGSAWQVLRPIHGRRRLQLHPPGQFTAHCLSDDEPCFVLC